MIKEIKRPAGNDSPAGKKPGRDSPVAKDSLGIAGMVERARESANAKKRHAMN
jgi:hypothetical protein